MVWDKCFPKYPFKKKAAIEAYWDEYAANAQQLEKTYPERFFRFSLSSTPSNFEEFRCIADKIELKFAAKEVGWVHVLNPSEEVHARGLLLRGIALFRKALSKLLKGIAWFFWRLRIDRLSGERDRVSAIIPHVGRSTLSLKKTIASLRSQTYAHLIKEIVVVSQRSDESDVWASEFSRDPLVKVHFIEKSDVFVKARLLNLGIREACSEYILISDSDLIFSPNYIEEALRTVRFDERCFVTSNTRDLLNDRVLLKDDFSFEQLMHDSVFRAELRRTPLYHYNRAILFCARDHFLNIQGYSDAYQGWGFEDDDLYCRLIDSGLVDKNLTDKIAYLHIPHDRTESNPARLSSNARWFKFTRKISWFVGGRLSAINFILKFIPKSWKPSK